MNRARGSGVEVQCLGSKEWVEGFSVLGLGFRVWRVRTDVLDAVCGKASDQIRVSPFNASAALMGGKQGGVCVQLHCRSSQSLSHSDCARRPRFTA